MREILTPDENINLLDEIKKKNSQNLPYVIVFLGVNGTGKTTTMAKIAHFLKNQGISSVAAASDTFRAGAPQSGTSSRRSSAPVALGSSCPDPVRRRRACRTPP